jgi:peptidoglycan/xylan/chitin deacetylase (PgdA/CDA1 family)
MSLVDRALGVVTRWLPAKTVRSRLTRPVASFTFDDFPKSAWSAGGPILAKHEAHATYYAAGSRCGIFADGSEQYDRSDLAAVAAAGHEIGCHSFGHVPSSTVSSAALDEDRERNAAFLRETLGDVSLASFAYPYGEVVPRTKLLFGRAFGSSRGIRSGLNAGMIDLAQLLVVPLTDIENDPAMLERTLEGARASNAWIVFMTHDVVEKHEVYGCRPATLDRVLAATRAAGIDILTMKHALARAVVGSEAPAVH